MYDVREQRSDIVIVAPHADDEIIGCFEVITHFSKSHIIRILYPDESELPSWYIESTDHGRRRIGFLPQSSNEVYPVKCFVGDECTPYLEYPETDENVYFVPDVIHEFHPDHRRWGFWGESIVRNYGARVYFYSINMQAPYIRPTEQAIVKRNVLNDCYPHKSSLWDGDHKYWLFEGYCRWIGNWNGDRSL